MQQNTNAIQLAVLELASYMVLCFERHPKYEEDIVLRNNERKKVSVVCWCCLIKRFSGFLIASSMIDYFINCTSTS